MPWGGEASPTSCISFPAPASQLRKGLPILRTRARSPVNPRVPPDASPLRKKLSNFLHTQHWKGASNYVAKRYIESVDRDVYFEDVRLQMEAKLWGEEYNRHKPPKQVDIMQMCVIELKERPGRPLFHLEHYIEGKYIKYNSNSGFVRDDNVRLTPQAFSHFTFERSGHQLIVVDIQGVGDLYTDPQIHTERGTDFGDGNLGRPGQPAGRSMETTRHPPKNLRALCCLKIAGLGDIGAFPDGGDEILGSLALPIQRV
uniref:Alpha-type protein kinase domain-containing protein n=1 Tax=Sus scrofa TaxID=9823 RepID=A0A4X1TV64_PIG